MSMVGIKFEHILIKGSFLLTFLIKYLFDDIFIFYFCDKHFCLRSGMKIGIVDLISICPSKNIKSFSFISKTLPLVLRDESRKIP